MNRKLTAAIIAIFLIIAVCTTMVSCDLFGESDPAEESRNNSKVDSATSEQPSDSSDNATIKSLAVNKIYNLAVQNGYTGSQNEFVSAVENGNAYQTAKSVGYVLSIEQWLSNIIKSKGNDEITATIDARGNFILQFADGTTETICKLKKHTKTNNGGITIGLICLHDENSLYDFNFIEALGRVQNELGLSDEQVIIRTSVNESNDCYEVACELADEGCDIIIGDSFGHELYLIQAAKLYPNVMFANTSGWCANNENLDNFMNAFAAIYEGTYLTGVAAGMKLNEMIEDGDIKANQAKIGYVGSFSFSEVISQYTSFYLGAKSICPTVTMDVKFVDSWYDESGENNAALSLIDDGCVLLGEYSNSLGVATACQEEGVPYVSGINSYYESNKIESFSQYITSVRIDWAPFFKYIIDCKTKNIKPAKDWVGNLATGSVVLEGFGKACAEGTIKIVNDVHEQLINNEIEVFDTSTFTVNGEIVTSYFANILDVYDFTPDTEVIIDGAFKESYFRSAPYFDLNIDGINLINVSFG